MSGISEQGSPVDGEGVRKLYRKASWITSRDGIQRGANPLVAFYCDDAGDAFGEQRACQSPRAGADLDDCRALEGAGCAGDAAGYIEIEDEMLAEALAGGQTKIAHDVPDGR